MRKRVITEGQAEVSVPDLGTDWLKILTRDYSVADVNGKEIHIILSPLTVDSFIELGLEYVIVDRPGPKGTNGSLNIHEVMEWDSYPTFPQYDSIMRFFASEYPLICRLDTIGESINGKLVMAVKISDNCTLNETEPEVFYTSSMHGDETGGFILMLRLIDYLLKNYQSDSKVSGIVDNLEIWINPLANPDGTFNNGDTIISPVRFNANHFDLNRDFPDPEIPATVRQKETLDMIQFLAAHRFVLSANFHSGAEVVNFPWDRWERDHADSEWFYRISRAYADTVHLHAPPEYMNYLDDGVTNGFKWYPVNGGRQDYVTYELQGREVSIELDDQYITPVARLEELWNYNRRSLLGYLENAIYGVTGMVTDSVSGDPVPASIQIADHDKDNSHVYSDTITGEFTRLLEPGTWSLTFSADGYRTRIFNDVSLSAARSTVLNVVMQKVLNPVDTTVPEKPLLYPNPGRTLVKAVLPEGLWGPINIKVISRAGLVVSDYNAQAIYGDPLVLDTGKFAPGTYFIVFTSRDTGYSMKAKLVVVR